MGLGFGLAVAPGVVAKVPKARVGDWRAQLSAQDRSRLRSWRDSWLKALADARQRGAASLIAGERPLLDPDAAIGFAAPPSGVYRCRTLKVGSQGQAGSGF